MPQKLSAGLLLYRRVNQDDKVVPEVLLAHMGGPFWSHQDDGAWSIPKGEHESGEDPFLAAKREFEEELGSAPPLVVPSADAVPWCRSTPPAWVLRSWVC